MQGKPIKQPQNEVEALTPEELEAVEKGLRDGTIKIVPIDHTDDSDTTSTTPDPDRGSR